MEKYSRTKVVLDVYALYRLSYRHHSGHRTGLEPVATSSKWITQYLRSCCNGSSKRAGDCQPSSKKEKPKIPAVVNLSFSILTLDSQGNKEQNACQ